MEDEFYIGWEDRAPRGNARRVRSLVALMLGTALALGALFAVCQRQIGLAFFEWGHPREFTGRLRLHPVPHLLMASQPDSPGRTPAAVPLVAPFKFGVDTAVLRSWDGEEVTLRATRIHRDGRLMLELEPGSVRRAGAGSGPGSAGIDPTLERPQSLGRHRLVGEIVDSKCWMGVMNPGALAPHRACAVRCLSGGIPPMLLVRRAGAPPLNLLLVSERDEPVNVRVLDFVAEPLAVEGEVVRRGDLLFLRIDPGQLRHSTPAETR